MGDKDIAEKLLIAYNDVAADIINVLVCNGQRLVKQEDLQTASTLSQYKFLGDMHHQERDVAKFLLDGKSSAILTCCGFENQTKVDKTMPIRVLAYDALSYRSQTGNKGLHEVITLVLYFGTSHWNASHNLQGCITNKSPIFPDTMRNDYKINVFEIAYLTPEQVNMFQSDFRYVADYVVQKRINKNYIPPKGTVKHVEEVLNTLTAISGVSDFVDIIPVVKEKGENRMDAMIARFIKSAEDRGEARGVARGEARGKIEASIATATDMIKDGLPASMIVKYSRLSLEKLQELAKSLNTTLVM